MKKVISLISLFLLVACSSNQSDEDASKYAFQITNSNQKLSLSLKKDGSNAEPDDLRIETLLLIEENTFTNLPSLDLLDNENTPYDYGKSLSVLGGNEYLTYFKYTFYVKNTSGQDTSLNIKFYAKDVTKENDNFSLTDTIRFMILENEANSSEHNYGVYAKDSHVENRDKDGNKTFKEFIAESNPSSNQETDEYPLVTASFQKEEIDKYYIKLSKDGLKANEQLRYTFVFWLEGNDSDSIIDRNVPTSASIRTGIEIF